MKIGYARVSTNDQNLISQIDALKNFGCEKIFVDKKSGKNLERDEFKKMLDILREKDTVVVFRLDRLSRSLKDLISTVESFNSKKINFISLHEKIDTSNASGNLIFHIFSSVAEFERNLIRERTRAGLESARRRGRIGGKPRKLNSKQVEKLKTLYKDEKLEIRDLCQMFGISRASLYRYVMDGKRKQGVGKQI